jgi:hypothetical protein
LALRLVAQDWQERMDQRLLVAESFLSRVSLIAVRISTWRLAAPLR